MVFFKFEYFYYILCYVVYEAMCSKALGNG